MPGAFSFAARGGEAFVPDGSPLASALARTTHLGIGAHPDDLEIMAIHGILECHGKQESWFTGVTLSDGGGSARTGAFAQKSDAEMIALRKEEQKRAARLGEYGAMLLLNHPSAAVKDPRDAGVAADLDRVFASATPEVVYTHNLADKHDTHVAAALRVIAAVRRMPCEQRPRRIIGCEVWRDLDWLDDADKVVMPVDGQGALPEALIAAFESQIAGGKRYDLAAAGRRLGHATFFESHAVDGTLGVVLGMDLTPLIADDAKDPATFAAEHVERLLRDVKGRIAKMG
jgi:LmbE family N-acetylglucosaminyl deacetylase